MTQLKGARTEPALPSSLTGRVENFRDFESTEFARESEFPGSAGGVLKRLDVNEETNRRKIRKVSSNAHLNQLFDDI